MDPAQASGGEHRYAGAGREMGGRGDGSGPVCVLCAEYGQVADACFHHRVGACESFERCILQPYAGLAVEDRHGGRQCAVLADRVLEFSGYPEIVRAGEAVGDQRALEGHDRTTGGEGSGDLGMHAHDGILPPRSQLRV